MTVPLTDREKSYFNTIRDKAPTMGALVLSRMMLDGNPVAVIGTDVFNRFTRKKEGFMPLALLVTDELATALVAIDGTGPAALSPFDLDPER